MGLELEVKILDINPEYEEDKIIKKGGRRVKEVSQKLYTYDLLSIHGRFQEIVSHLESNNLVEIDVNFEKLKNLFWEIDNFDSSLDLSFFEDSQILHLGDILNHTNWKELIKNVQLMSYLKRLGTNPCKWIRLRKTNERTTLAVKHILDNEGRKMQNLIETEISVSSFEETDMLLQQLGFVHKSYQEKKRIIFEISEHEIDFDFWPGIPPFMEFEGDSIDDIKRITTLLEYTLEDVVSCTADEIYKMYGKDMFEGRTLTF